MRFQKERRVTGFAVLLLIVAVLGGMVQIAGLGQAGVNDVDVDFDTYYTYRTRQVGSIPNQELLGSKRAVSYLYNSKDLTGEDVKSPMLTFTTGLPVDVSYREHLVPGTTYRWEFPDLPEEESYWVSAYFAPSEDVAFTPGFSVDYSLDPVEFNAPSGRQEVKITVTPEDWEIMIGGDLSVGIDVEETDQVIPLITSITSGRGDTWLDPEGQSAWWASGRGPGGTYIITATIDVELKDGVELARHLPTVTVEARIPKGEGKEVAENSLIRTMTTGVGEWEWTTSDPYTWTWEEWLRKRVEFQGFSAPGFHPPTKEAIDAAIDKALTWLDHQQNADGSWDYVDRGPSVGITAMAALAFLQRGYPEGDPTVSRAIQFILQKQQDDGSISSIGWYTYETSLAILVLIATGNPEYKDEIAKAVDYLVEAQNDEDKDYGKYGYEGFSCPDPGTCPAYGGWNYSISGISWTSETKRPFIRSDNSNTQFALWALAAAGLPADSDVWRKAEDWVTRCQNPDGGFAYKPPKLCLLEETTPGRSFGSMTAAGIFGLRLCEVPITDKRIQDALSWLQRFYVYHENPQQGGASWHYYYLMTATRAFLYSDLPGVLEPKLPLEGWYWDFAGYLVEYQEEDGRWMNPEESYPGRSDIEVTEYALLVLEKVALPTP